MSTTAEPQPRELSAEEWDRLVDEHARRHLGTSGAAFRSAWEAGELDAGRDDVLRVAMLLPE